MKAYAAALGGCGISQSWRGFGLSYFHRVIAAKAMNGGIRRNKILDVPNIDYAADPVFKRMQWEIRAAYEAGYTAASGSMHERSDINPNKGKWFDHWMNSKSRAFLIGNGIISGDDDYR